MVIDLDLAKSTQVGSSHTTSPHIGNNAYMSVGELEALINSNDQFEYTLRGDVD